MTRRVKSAVLIASLLSLAAHAGEPWHEGEFEGRTTLRGGQMTWRARCIADAPCTLTFEQASAVGTASETLRTKVPTSFDTTIPNNNLAHTRRAIRETPALLRDPQEGPLLIALGTILVSDATFDACLDIGGDAGGQILLCSLTTDPEAADSAVLLAGTMKPACGRDAFCAYLLLPLARLK